MAVVETRHNIITDKDIKRNHILSEKKNRSVKVKYALLNHSTAEAHRQDTREARKESSKHSHAIESHPRHHHIEHVENSKNNSLKSVDISVKVRPEYDAELKSGINDVPKPYVNPGLNEEIITDSKSGTKGKFASLRDTIRMYLPGGRHELSKEESSSSASPPSSSVSGVSAHSAVMPVLEQKGMLKDDKSASVSAFMASAGNVQNARRASESGISEQKEDAHIERMKSRLDDIEHTVHEMNALLKKGASVRANSKTGSDKIHNVTGDFGGISKSSKEVRELVKKEDRFSGDIMALEQVYKDGIISQESFEENKRQIEKNICDIEDAVLRTLEKEELDDLKKRLEDEIRTSLTAGPFSAEQKRYHEDINALAKIYEVGLINEKEYNAKKEELKSKLNKADDIIARIDAVFEEYRKDLIDVIREKEATVEARVRPQKSLDVDPDKDDAIIKESVHYKPKGFLGKMKTLLGISGAGPEISASDPVIVEMRKIKKTESRRDALIKCSFILKGLAEKKIGLKEECTYNQLIGKLRQSPVIPEISDSLVRFFEKVSLGVYSDTMNHDELPQLLDEVEVLAVKIQKISVKGETKLEASASIVARDKVAVKKSGIIEKINSFFGV